jgi:phasin family protein
MKIKPLDTTLAIDADATEAAAAGFDRTVGTLKDGMTAAASGAETTQSKMKEGFAKAMKTTEELVEFNQGTVDAVVKSGQIWASGVQDLSKQWAASAQTAMDETLSTFKALTSVKSLKEAMDLQTSLARSSMERAMSEGGRFTEASVKLVEQTMAPLAARMTAAVEKFGKPAI